MTGTSEVTKCLPHIVTSIGIPLISYHILIFVKIDVFNCLQDLFDFIASSLQQFVEKEGNGSSSSFVRRELGFTFSFPVKQSSVSSGLLLKWTKGFAMEDMVSWRIF